MFRSTPPRRGRRRDGRALQRQRLLGSTPPRRGGDRRPGGRDLPAGGATRAAARGATYGANVCFGPRPREGGDSGGSAGVTYTQVFRSTPPRRGRPFRIGL